MAELKNLSLWWNSVRCLTISHFKQIATWSEVQHWNFLIGYNQVTSYFNKQS